MEKESQTGVWGVTEMINLMAFVAHQTLQFSVCRLSSQAERNVCMMKSYVLGNTSRDDKAGDCSTGIA